MRSSLRVIGGIVSGSLLFVGALAACSKTVLPVGQQLANHYARTLSAVHVLNGAECVARPIYADIANAKAVKKYADGVRRSNEIARQAEDEGRTPFAQRLYASAVHDSGDRYTVVVILVQCPRGAIP